MLTSFAVVALRRDAVETSIGGLVLDTQGSQLGGCRHCLSSEAIRHSLASTVCERLGLVVL
jgi:hypothetical protein